MSQNHSFMMNGMCTHCALTRDNGACDTTSGKLLPCSGNFAPVVVTVHSSSDNSTTATTTNNNNANNNSTSSTTAAAAVPSKSKGVKRKSGRDGVDSEAVAASKKKSKKLDDPEEAIKANRLFAMFEIKRQPDPLTLVGVNATEANFMFRGLSADVPYNITYGMGKLTCSCPSFQSNTKLSCKHILYMLYHRLNVSTNDLWKSRSPMEIQATVSSLRGILSGCESTTATAAAAGVVSTSSVSNNNATNSSSSGVNN